MKKTFEELELIKEKILDLCVKLKRIPTSEEIYEQKIIGDLRPLKSHIKEVYITDWINYFRICGYGTSEDVYINNKYKSLSDLTYEEVILLYKEFKEKSGKLPTIGELRIENNLPNYMNLKRILKENNINIEDFYIEVGSKHYKSKIENYNLYIERFKEISDKLNRPLKCHELAQYKLPCMDWLIENCPNKSVTNYGEFVEWCGYKPLMKMSKELATEIIYNMQSKLGRPLMYDDFKNPSREEMSISIVNKYWGGLNKMKEALGLEIIQDDMVNRQKSKEEMLDDMKTFIKELGRLPLSKEINKNKNMLSCAAYCRYFGSLNKVFLQLGYKPNKKCISLYLSNEEIVNLYKDFIEELGFTPAYDYCKRIYNLPSPRTVIRRFNCSWNEFIEMLGYIPNSDCNRGEICYAKDGTQCFSTAETVIHNYFLDGNINIINKEYMYRELVDKQELKDMIGYKRLDWLIEYNNQFYGVEYFGLMGNYDYNIRHDLKLNFIKKANLENNFIALYPKDLNRLDEVFNFIIDKNIKEVI